MIIVLIIGLLAFAVLSISYEPKGRVRQAIEEYFTHRDSQ